MAESDWTVEKISGAELLINWFGDWPSFHDAEITELHLSRTSHSWLKLHTWAMSNEVDDQGYLVLKKHAIVTISLEEILDLELTGFNHQNVIEGLRIRKTDEGLELELLECFGLAGTILAREVSISFDPVQPEVVSPC